MLMLSEFIFYIVCLCINILHTTLTKLDKKWGNRKNIFLIISVCVIEMYISPNYS